MAERVTGTDIQLLEWEKIKKKTQKQIEFLRGFYDALPSKMVTVEFLTNWLLRASFPYTNQGTDMLGAYSPVAGVDYSDYRASVYLLALALTQNKSVAKEVTRQTEEMFPKKDSSRKPAWTT